MSNDENPIAAVREPVTTCNPARSYDFAQVDVFAEHSLEGNALAVFHDARGLSTAQMQAIARETNLSETTFILPRSAEIEQERGIQVRIFLTDGEVPFAGHPTLGTASWLYWNHPRLKDSTKITLDLGVGPITVRFTPPHAGERGVFGIMRQNDPIFGAGRQGKEERIRLAAALGLLVEDIDSELPIQVVSTGMAFCIVVLKTLDAASRLSVVAPLAREYLECVGAKFFYCVTRAAAGGSANWHARMQFGTGEDPATGSAAGCAIAYFVQHEVVASGEAIVIEQGIEMHRPSRIHVSATRKEESITKVFVGGRTIPVAMGRLFLS
jgi:trans-2,3-dihydro-3-hydroxyanthranilate isomerase